MAGVPADSIGYVEAHGTATALGDPIEIEALTRAFRAGTDRDAASAPSARSRPTSATSTGAAGVAGLIKTVLALEHREIPPSLHFERAEPARSTSRRARSS